MGIFDCGFDVCLCCATDTHTSPAFPVLLCYWDEAENWDHWSDIPKGKTGSISWAGTPVYSQASGLSSQILREEQAYWRRMASWNIKDGFFGEFLGVLLSYFTEFSSYQQLNVAVLVGHQTYRRQILVHFKYLEKESRRIVCLCYELISATRLSSECYILLEIKVLRSKPFHEVMFFGD